MKLRKQGLVFERRGCQALAESCKSFRGMAHEGFILRREEKWAEKRAVNAIAEGQLGVLQLFEKILRKIRRLLEQGPEKLIPGLNWVLPGSGSVARCHRFAVPDGADCAACATRGAPVNPAAAPMPSISSHRGQVLAMFPCRARSITSRDIFSTTCSK